MDINNYSQVIRYVDSNKFLKYTPDNNLTKIRLLLEKRSKTKR